MSETSAARILIAEDNPQGAELLEAYVADAGYDVRIATDGESTLQLVRDWKPDVVLLDVMMPKISGFEVCKRIRSDPATRGIGVLMVTALDQPSDVERAVDVGTHDFLTKPIHKADLLLRIQALLASRSGDELADTLTYLEAVQKGGS
ncbi:MAG: response regulator [Gemmataceae bacterium]|nr:response regulator [Gemmataceae bacterium]